MAITFSKHSRNTIIKIILKLSISFLIILFLVVKGQLDFSLVSAILDYPMSLATALILLAVNVFLTSFRWKMILETQKINCPHLLIITKLTWIGIFFSTFLPGVVSGDFIKVMYTKKHSQNLETSLLIVSTLLDRLLGLCGLILLSNFVSILFYHDLIVLSKHIKYIIQTNFLLGISVMVFYSLLFIPFALQKRVLFIICKVPKIGVKLSRVVEKIWSIGTSKQTILNATLMSIVTQFINIFAFWIITRPFLSQSITLRQITSILPIGFISIAVPISPAGLGVGHSTFNELLSLLGENNGASLFNLFFLASIAINALGVFPYVFKKKHLEDNLLAPEKSDVEYKSI